MGKPPIEGSNPSLSASLYSAPVAQLDRAPGYELGGREFESLRAHHRLEAIVLSLPPLSLYIHFPWCVHKCPYCDFNSHTLRGNLPEKDYIKTLLRDFQQERPQIQGRVINSIYLGGGTPSLFSGDAIAYLLQQIQSLVDIAPDAEMSIEANPESVILEKLECYHNAGINRISLGIQSLQDIYLKRLGRAHDSVTASQAMKTVIQAGFMNFNVDLMYGLPGQTAQAGLEDVQAALALGPPHLSWYQLTLEPNTAFFKKPPILPHEDAVIDLQMQGLEELVEAGYEQYEISAFSREGFACRHNNNYWAFGDYIGIGAGAHSKVTHLESGGIIRYWKWYNPRVYLSAQHFREGSERLTPQQLPFEFMLNSLRCYQPITRDIFESRTGLRWESLVPTFEKATDKGLLQWGNEWLIVTPFGRHFYNDLVTLFL
jgi:putative oxygen-independent coproporphyrinogen III oxidase